MKIKYGFKIATYLIICMFLLSGCYGNFEPTPESSSNKVVNYTIDSLIKTFVSPIGDLPTRIPGLFSVDTISSTKDVFISGVVISNDNDGNIYKYIIIQDSLSGRAIKISVDAGNLSAIFPLGQVMIFNCRGLAIGKYADMLQIGTPFYKTESGKIGYEIGRIPYPAFMKRAQAGKYAANLLTEMVDTVTIDQILKGGNTMHNKLICIKNAYFTGNGADFGKPKAITVDSLKIFAPSTEGIGFPQSREIKDGTGSVFVATSEYSKFAKYKLPASTIVGNITAIVGWYNDKDLTLDNSKIYHQLTLRSIADLGKGFETYRANFTK